MAGAFSSAYSSAFDTGGGVVTRPGIIGGGLSIGTFIGGLAFLAIVLGG